MFLVVQSSVDIIIIIIIIIIIFIIIIIIIILIIFNEGAQLATAVFSGAIMFALHYFDVSGFL